jgi:subtilisin family serine protease
VPGTWPPLPKDHNATHEPMKTTRLLALATLLLSAPLAAAQGLDQEVSLATTPEEIELVGSTPYVEGQLILRFRFPTTRDEAGATLDPERYVVDELCAPLDMFVVYVTDGTRVIDAIRELAAIPAVLYAVPDHVVTSRQTFPNDPSFGTQWNMHNTGAGSATADADIDAVEAWDLGTGSKDFVVCVVDGGMYINHPDLSGNLYQNALEVSGLPGVDDDGNGYVDDKNGWDAYSNDGTIPGDGHGSHVNGIAGADGNNGTGVAGVNWDVTLMPVAGSTGTTTIVVRAYTYAYDQKNLWLSSGGAQGANVVATNSSFGVNFGNCTSVTYAPWNNMYDLMGSVGILSAAATMNLASDVDVAGDVPTSCASDWLISVTNTTNQDRRNSGAAWGRTTIDLGAPGTSVLSTGTSTGYNTLTGTSMASPHVAGAVAYMHSVASPAFQAQFAADPGGAAKTLKSIMLANVDTISDLATTTVSGGRLNINNAGIAINNWTSGGVPCPYSQYGTGLGAPHIATLTSGSSAEIGLGQTIDMSGFNGSGSASLFLSKGQGTTAFLGGTLLVSQSGIIKNIPVTITGGAGSGSFTLPSNPGLIGRSFYLQAFMADGSQVQGWAMSNGLTATICQ